jgi:hypothetical protein
MTFNMRYPPGLAAAFMFLDMAIGSVASAQDVMQLDLAFKNGQLPTSREQGHAVDLQDRRQDVGAAPKQTKAARRHPRLHRHQKT